MTARTCFFETLAIADTTTTIDASRAFNRLRRGSYQIFFTASKKSTSPYCDDGISRILHTYLTVQLGFQIPKIFSIIVESTGKNIENMTKYAQRSYFLDQA